MQFYTPDKPMSVCKKVTRVGKSGNAMKGGGKKGGEGGAQNSNPTPNQRLWMQNRQKKRVKKSLQKTVRR